MKYGIFGSVAVWKIIAKIFASIAVIAYVLHITFVANADLFLNSDFLSFFTGAKIILDGKASLLYDIPTQLSYQTEIKGLYEDQIGIYPRELLSRVLPFRNLPFVALFFIPFAPLPGLVSYKLFALLSVLFLILFLYGLKSAGIIKMGFYSLILISVIFLPVLTSVYRGQLTLVALFVFYLIYKNLVDRQSGRAGMLSGLLFMKLQYLIAVPILFFLAKDSRKFLKGFLLVASFVWAVCFSISGKGIFDYLPFLILTEQSYYGSVPVEVLTLFSIFRVISGSTLLAFVLNISLYLVFLYFFIKNKASFSLMNAFGITIIATLVFGVHMTDNDVVLMLFPILWALGGVKKNIWSIIFIILAICAPWLKVTRIAFFESFFIVALGVIYFVNSWGKDIDFGDKLSRKKRGKILTT